MMVLKMDVSPKKIYKRDKRSPLPLKEATSYLMSKIKGKNTIPEILFRKGLSNRGIKGYRIHYKKLPGSPDICFIRKKIAIYIHGCFWHRCPTCKPHLPKAHSLYWQTKFQKNIERDERHYKTLKEMGWTPIVIWECKINDNLKKQIYKIERLLTNERS